MWMIRDVVEIILLVIREMHRLLTSYENFADLEKGIYRLVQQITLRLLVIACSHLDEQLMRDRDAKRLELVHTKPRVVVTPFGEVALERRYYRDRETGEGRFLLDEALGLAPRQRLSPWTTELAVAAAAEMPYHRAAAWLRQVTLGAEDIRAMTLWHEVQEAGKRLAERAEQERSAVFDRGEVPAARRKSQSLRVEADEVWVAARNSRRERRKLAIKVSVGYEGKATIGPHRRSLLERRVVAGVAGAKVFWEQAVAQFGRHWDLSAVEDCYVGGDGAPWVKLGCEYFPRATYRLDPYHLRRALLEGLGHDEAVYTAVCAALAAEDWAEVEKTLVAAERASKGAQRRRIVKLRRYLQGNWEGICQSEVAERLGTIEGQVFHHVARRIKRHGARWSDTGADHLVHLLPARANGELPGVARQVWRAQPELIRRAAGDKPIRAEGRPSGQDPSAWLRASLPALCGPSADEPWVKYVLRVLTQTLPVVA